jgi:hypothetical protein
MTKPILEDEDLHAEKLTIHVIEVAEEAGTRR